MKKALAFDIGGTKIYSTIIDETGNIIEEIEKFSTPKTIDGIKEVLKKYPNDIKIYAVSIDIGHNTWRNAIEKDQTQEFIHVIGTDQDRRNVRSVEVLGIERIPRNFLLDRNCRIIAKDLHDEQLMQTLDSLTKQ